MPVTSVTTNTDDLTMTIVADFSTSKQRLWDAYTDPRLIEQFWGPVTYPATFFRHDMFPGGQSRYAMRGPDGDVSTGYWEFLSVDAPNGFEVLDGFCGDDGEPNRDLPSMRMVFAFDETSGGSRLTMTTHFSSLDELEKLVEMDMVEGTESAMSQIDAVLADLVTFAADMPTNAQELSDTQVRIARVIRGSVGDVWRAHHDAELLKRWLLGPDGWEMDEVTPPGEAGSTYRYHWAPTGDTEGAPFAISGMVVSSQPERRVVHTEQMEGMPGETLNDVTFTPVPDGTLLTYVITYDSRATRDAVLATGMTDGMEASYVRLEGALA